MVEAGGGHLAFEAERLALAQIRVDSGEAYERAVRSATEIGAHALGVERVGVWHLRGDRELELTHLYTASNRRHSTERQRLTLADPSAYGAALHARRALVSNDVAVDPVTVELAGYFRPLGITSTLDAPFYYRGSVGGVICHEHVGPARTWTTAEIGLACSIADMAAVICGQAQILDVQAQLHDSSTRRLDSSHVETLAHIATAIGHELSNTLTAIQFAMLRIESSSDPRVAELAPALAGSLSLATRLLDGLKNFGRAGLVGGRTSLGSVLPALVPMLQLMTRDSATVRLELPDPDLEIALSDGELQQIVVNLVVNAANALVTTARSGTIEISAREHPGGRVELVVSDDGPGIAPEVADKLFGLYFTTRDRGSGIGLWLVKQIVEEVGGSVRFEPASRGARFVVELPRRTG